MFINAGTCFARPIAKDYETERLDGRGGPGPYQRKQQNRDEYDFASHNVLNGNSSIRILSRSFSSCSGVAPSCRRMLSVMASATSPSPANTSSAPADRRTSVWLR